MNELTVKIEAARDQVEIAKRVFFHKIMSLEVTDLKFFIVRCQTYSYALRYVPNSIKLPNSTKFQNAPYNERR